MGSTGVGIIGAGERGIFVLGLRLAEMAAETDLRIVSICDVDSRRLEEGRHVLEETYREKGIAARIRTYERYADLIADPAVDCVFVTTFTSSHRGPAVDALLSGKRVYLDKPMATTEEDGRAIMEAERTSGIPVIMGFTRRYENAWRTAHKIIEQGRIGSVQMILLRSVIPYARYLQRWHRKNGLSGGALNDKVAHYFDVLNWFAGAEPELVSAVGGRSTVFKPQPDAPRVCRQCDRICAYRAMPSEQVKELGQVYRLDAEYRKQSRGIFDQQSWIEARIDSQALDNCVYRADSDIIDHALINLVYANGVKASVFWSIFGPNADDEETIEFVGSTGRLRLIRNTGEIDIVADYGLEQEHIDARGSYFGSSHFGADIELVHEIDRYCNGARPTVTTADGYRALALVTASQHSITDGGRPITPNIWGVPRE